MLPAIQRMRDATESYVPAFYGFLIALALAALAVLPLRTDGSRGAR